MRGDRETGGAPWLIWSIFFELLENYLCSQCAIEAELAADKIDRAASISASLVCGLSYLPTNLEKAMAATSRAVLVTDATKPHNPIAYANAAFSVLSGYSAEDVIGLNCRFLQGQDTDRQVVAEIGASIAAGSAIRRSILNYRKDGTPFWNDLTIDPIRDDAGRITGYIGVQSPADDAHLAVQERAEVQARLASIADHIPGYIYRRILRADGVIELAYFSPSIRKILGVSEAEAARTFYSHVHPDDLERLTQAISNSAAHMSTFREEFRLISLSGATHWLRSDAPPRRMANGDIVWDGLAIEISAEKRWESEIAKQALRDPLTGLLTRAAWRQALEVQLGTNAQGGALLYFDIMCFHDHNEGLGQAGGDDILRETAWRLTQVARSLSGVSGRLGGDEFALLVPDCADKHILAEIAKAAGSTLSMPMQIGEQFRQIRMCIGATLYTDIDAGLFADDNAASELMGQAELALGWAKQACDGPVIYSREQDDRFQNAAVIRRSQEDAVSEGQFELHYQPLVDLSSGKIVSAEALVRWNHPTLGLQRPDLFIPLAEQSGLIVPLGHWVLRTAFRQRTAWLDAGLRPPSIALNISAVQLLEIGFVSLVRAALDEANAKADDFELELTESLLIGPSPQVMAVLLDLRAMGFTITIDDFGSGHATFRYLRDFPVDKLKIDQVFVRKLVLESTDALIIRAVLALSRSMHIAFVAEGIETEMQRDFLLREGCEIGQGYLFSLPLIAEDFAWLTSNDVRLPLRPAALDVPDADRRLQPEMEPDRHD